MKRKTVGALVAEQNSKVGEVISPTDLFKANEKTYIDELFWTIAHAQKKVMCKTECRNSCKDKVAHLGDLFVEVGLRVDNSLTQGTINNPFAFGIASKVGIPRFQFMWKKNCPSPRYDQTVYHYKSDKNIIDFIWSLPDRNACKFMIANKSSLPTDQYQLLKFVLDLEDGSLEKLAMELNGEIKNGTATVSPIILVK